MYHAVLAVRKICPYEIRILFPINSVSATPEGNDIEVVNDIIATISLTTTDGIYEDANRVKRVVL